MTNVDLSYIAEDLRPLAVPIETLRLDPKNMRRHDKANRAAVKASLLEHGQQKPVVVREDGTVAAGNCTLMVALELGWTHLARSRFDRGSFDASRAYALRDNRTAELATWADELEHERWELAELGWSAPVLGWSLPVASSSSEPEAEIPEISTLAPIAQPGDLWTLGAHRLLCADSLDAANLRALLGKERVDLVSTDPPFAIYGSSSGVSTDIADDKMVRPFFEGVFRVLATHARNFAHLYVHCDWRSLAPLWYAGVRVGLSPRNLIVWDKLSSGLGSMWANTYELIAFFVKVPPRKAMRTGETGHRQVHKPNLVRCARASGAERLHNAAKPVELVRMFVEAGSDPGELVLDLFLGSGSTIIACEELGRRCVGLEMEPRTVDVIVARWERKTGQKAVRTPGFVEVQS